MATQYNVTFSTPLTKPNAHLQTTALVKVSSSGSPVTNLATVSVSPLFPDGSSSTYTLAGGGVVNSGSGNYTLSYQSKGPGLMRERWTCVGADGTNFSGINIIPVAF